jgi:hypothetical protein
MLMGCRSTYNQNKAKLPRRPPSLEVDSRVIGPIALAVFRHCRFLMRAFYLNFKRISATGTIGALGPCSVTTVSRVEH